MSTKEKVSEQTDVQVSGGYRVFSFFRSLFVYLLAIGIIVAALLFASNRSPDKSLFGYRYYTVLTPSMVPAFDAGDMVFVRITKADSINVGDVITFNPSSSSDAYLTHRVTEKLENYEGTGVTCFRTKGDANDSEDSFIIDESRVIGTVQFHIPKLGLIVRFVQLRWYYVVGIIVLFIVFFRLLRAYFDSGEDESPEPAGEGKEAKPENGDAK